jgi:hypothetical protein
MNVLKHTVVHLDSHLLLIALPQELVAVLPEAMSALVLSKVGLLLH